MSKLKVLMVGPGAPSSQNSGLGVAADGLARNLGEFVELSIIEPGDDWKSKSELSIFEDSYKDGNLIRDIIRFQIKTSMNPYVYAAGEVERMESHIESSELQLELSRYTDQLIQVSAELEFDVIYAHDWISIEAAVAIKKATKKPLILHIHSLDYDRSGGVTDSWIFQLEKQGLEIADSIIAVSAYTKGGIAEFYGIDAKKIHVVHNAVEARPIVRKKKFDESLIAFVGRLTAQKGVSQFLDVACLVAEIIPETRFVIVGAGDLRDQLIDSGAYDRLGTKLHFTGHINQEERDEVLSMADVLCMPSVSEPFGLSALEAAAAEVPVIISSASGIAEILTGASIVPNDIQGFADAILHLIKNPEDAQKQIAANTKSIKASLGWMAASKKVAKILNDASK